MILYYFLFVFVFISFLYNLISSYACISYHALKLLVKQGHVFTRLLKALKHDKKKETCVKSLSISATEKTEQGFFLCNSTELMLAYIFWKHFVISIFSLFFWCMIYDGCGNKVQFVLNLSSSSTNRVALKRYL